MTTCAGGRQITSTNVLIQDLRDDAVMNIAADDYFTIFVIFHFALF